MTSMVKKGAWQQHVVHTSTKERYTILLQKYGESELVSGSDKKDTISFMNNELNYICVYLNSSPMNQPPSLVVFVYVDHMSSFKGGDKSNLDRKLEPSLEFIVNELSQFLHRQLDNCEMPILRRIELCL